MPIKLSLLVACAAAWSCDSQMLSQLPGAPGTRVILEPAPSRKTTSERIAVANLDATIDVFRRRLAEEADVEIASKLVEHLMLRADFYGTFDDWEEALDVSTEILESHPADPAAALVHARVLNTLHEFDAARAIIEEARGGKLDRLDSALEVQARHLEATIGVAVGDPIDELVAQRRVLAAAVPTYQNVTSLGLALAKQGRYEEADDALRRALSHYRDVSPFPFAWVAFQRGVMWSEQAGRPDLGRVLYEEALRYLPGYVLANVHLAELEAASGDIAAAIARIAPLVGTTQDPEPVSLLAAIEPSDERARLYAAEAERVLRKLVDRFPEAFAHHLSEAGRAPVGFTNKRAPLPG